MPNKKAVIETKKGTIELDLFADEVPGTVANFEKLANSSFYDGTKFHRVIPNFMVQGGDPYSKTGKGPVGTGGPGYTIKCETQKNTHKHVAGTLSMAHAGQDTGGSQFFNLSFAATPSRRPAHRVRAGHQGHGCRQRNQGKRRNHVDSASRNWRFCWLLCFWQ